MSASSHVVPWAQTVVALPAPAGWAPPGSVAGKCQGCGPFASTEGYRASYSASGRSWGTDGRGDAIHRAAEKSTTSWGITVHVRNTRKIVTIGIAVALAAGAVTAGAATAGQASGRPTARPLPDGTTPVMGGHLNISGEAEVGSPWTPAAMRCDSYCYVRARTFFDQVAVLGADGQVQPFLAQSIEPNEDFTEWTITVREGITFTDGTPLDAAAMIYNLQAAGTGILVTTSLKDIARVPDPEDAERMLLKIEQLDDMSFTIFTGESGDPEKPISWRNFPAQLMGQWGLIASPTWLEEVVANPELAIQPVGTGPFIVDSYEPRGFLELSRNPDYWLTDAAGNQLPYLDSITFRVIEDSTVSAEALQAGDIDLVASSNGRAISTIQNLGDEFTVNLQDEYSETGYVLLDLEKPHLGDQRVRCALSMAIDRDELNESTTDGFNEAAYALFSPGQQGYLEDNGAVQGTGPRDGVSDDRRVRGGDRRERRDRRRPHPVDDRGPGCRADHGLVVRDRRRRLRPDGPAERLHQPRRVRRPRVPSVPVAPARRRVPRPAVRLVALRQRQAGRRAVAELRPPARPRHRRRTRRRPPLDRPTKRRSRRPRRSTGSWPSSATTSR